MGVSQDWGYPFGGPRAKHYCNWGSILGSPHLGKLANISKGQGIYIVQSNFAFCNRSLFDDFGRSS